MEFERRKKVETRLNIAPLIDCVFLLLLFFMLTSSFMMQPNIKLTLPSSTTAKVEAEEHLIIFIGKDNDLFLNQNHTTLEALPEQLGARIKKSRKKVVTIKADKDVHLGFAIRIIDIAKEAGASGFTVAAKLEEKKK